MQSSVCSVENRAGQSLKLYSLGFSRLLKYLATRWNTLKLKVTMFSDTIFGMELIAAPLGLKRREQPPRRLPWPRAVGFAKPETEWDATCRTVIGRKHFLLKTTPYA